MIENTRLPSHIQQLTHVPRMAARSLVVNVGSLNWTLQLLFLMVDHNHRKTSDTGIKLRRVTTIDPLTVSMNLWHGITQNDLETTHLRHERPCKQSPLYNYHCIRCTQAYFKEISPHKKVCNTTLYKKYTRIKITRAKLAKNKNNYGAERNATRPSGYRTK